MEYVPAILRKQRILPKVYRGLYKKVVYYKKHRKKIESEHFPYNTILTERLYKRWQKKYG